MTAWQVKWAEHKYWVMARSQQLYNQIRVLAKNNEWTDETTLTFDKLIDEAARQAPTRKTLTTAYEHVWGYFRDTASPSEKTGFQKARASYAAGELPLFAVKRRLRLLAEAHREIYLTESYYFLL